MGFWLRQNRQINDTTGNQAFEVTNSVPITSANLEDKGMLKWSNPDPMPYFYNFGIVRVRDMDLFVDVSTYGTTGTWVQPFGVESDKIVSDEEIVARGYYDFSETKSAFLVVNFPSLAFDVTCNVYCFSYNALILNNGRLSKFYT